MNIDNRKICKTERNFTMDTTMKKILLPLTALLVMLCGLLMFASCNTSNTPQDTTAQTLGDTMGETPTQPSQETTPDNTEEETQMPTFDPTTFTPAALPVANVAREGYALATSCKNDKGYLNLYLNDGDKSKGFSTVWGENHDESKAYEIFIDLTRAYPIDHITLYPLAGDEVGFPKGLEVLVSADGVTYTSVTTLSDLTPKESGVEIAMSGTEAQFVKIKTTRLGDGTAEKGKYLALSEFEVYAPIDTSSNMMLNRHDIWLYQNPDTSCQLQVMYYRDGHAPDQASTKLLFATADKTIATVSPDGVISPVGVGETDVYVSDGTNMAICHVEVKAEDPTDVRITTFYHSNFAYPEQIPTGLDVLAAAGIEYIEDTRAFDRVGNSISLYTLYLCDKRGIAYSPCDMAGGHGFLSMKDEEILEIVQKYEHRAGFFGIYLADEPHDEYLQFAHVFNVIQAYNAHLTPHLNLLPPYNFGGTGEYFTEFAAVAHVVGQPRMKYLSYDHYPFMWGGGFNSQVYESLNMLRKTGLLFQADTGFYMQSMVITNAYREMSDLDLMYNASLGMAYGIKNFKWFVALTPVGSGEAFTTGLVAPDFTPSTMHAGVTAANQYIKTVGRVLGNADAIEVYHTDSVGGNQQLPDDFIITPVLGSHAIYSLYQTLDQTRQQYVVITTKQFSNDRDMSYTLKFNGEGDLKRLNLQTGEFEAITLGGDGSFELSIHAGQCAVIMLPEGTNAALEDTKSDNLALGKPVYATSSSATFWEKSPIATYHLTNQDTQSGYWLAKREDKAPAITLDLLKVNTIDTLRIFMSKDSIKGQRAKNFTVLISEDGVNFTQLTTVSNYDWSDVSKPLELTFEAVNARYIRFIPETARSSAFGEIEVYQQNNA